MKSTAFVKAFSVLLLAVVCSVSASAQTPPGTLGQPAESLLLITADVQRHLNDDVYRFPYAQDASGQNIFRASLVRLANYEKLYAGKMTDVVAMVKAQAFEKLGAFKEAGANYLEAEKSKDSAIKKAASTGLARAKVFSDVADLPIDRTALRPFERDLLERIRKWKEVAIKYSKTPYESLALLQKEQSQMELAQFYISMRWMQPYDLEDALDQIKTNLKENPTSKRRFQHHLMLGNLHYTLAREYVVLHDPEGAAFDDRRFNDFVAAARTEFTTVENADGFDEKVEGRAMLQALDEFSETILNRAQ